MNPSGPIHYSSEQIAFPYTKHYRVYKIYVGFQLRLSIHVCVICMCIQKHILRLISLQSMCDFVCLYVGIRTSGWQEPVEFGPEQWTPGSWSYWGL